MYNNIIKRFFFSNTKGIHVIYITCLINKEDIKKRYKNVLPESFRTENQLHVQ